MGMAPIPSCPQHSRSSRCKRAVIRKMQSVPGCCGDSGLLGVIEWALEGQVGGGWTGACRKAVLWETSQQWEDREENVQRPRGRRAGCCQRYTERATVADVWSQQGEAVLCRPFGVSGGGGTVSVKPSWIRS